MADEVLVDKPDWADKQAREMWYRVMLPHSHTDNNIRHTANALRAADDRGWNEGVEAGVSVCDEFTNSLIEPFDDGGTEGRLWMAEYDSKFHMATRISTAIRALKRTPTPTGEQDDE